MATGWRRRGTGRHDSKPGLRAKTRRSGPACYRKGSLPAAGWRRKQYWRNATYTKSQTLPKRRCSLSCRPVTHLMQIPASSVLTCVLLFSRRTLLTQNVLYPRTSSPRNSQILRCGMMRLDQFLDVYRPQDQLLPVDELEAGNRSRGFVVLVRAHHPLYGRKNKNESKGF